jgi:hypothetical protein
MHYFLDAALKISIVYLRGLRLSLPSDKQVTFIVPRGTFRQQSVADIGLAASFSSRFWEYQSQHEKVPRGIIPDVRAAKFVPFNVCDDQISDSQLGKRSYVDQKCEMMVKFRLTLSGK